MFPCSKELIYFPLWKQIEERDLIQYTLIQHFTSYFTGIKCKILTMAYKPYVICSHSHSRIQPCLQLLSHSSFFSCQSFPILFLLYQNTPCLRVFPFIVSYAWNTFPQRATWLHPSVQPVFCSALLQRVNHPTKNLPFNPNTLYSLPVQSRCSNIWNFWVRVTIKPWWQRLNNSSRVS